MSIEGATPALRLPTRSELSQLGQWLAYHVIGSLMPLWGTVIFVMVFGSKDTDGTSHSWKEHIADGQLFLFAAALVVGGFYYLHKDTGWKHPWHGWFTVIGVFLLLVSSLVFAMNMALMRGQLPEGVARVTPRGLVGISLAVYMGAILMASGRVPMTIATRCVFIECSPKGYGCSELDGMRRAHRKMHHPSSRYP